VASREVAVLLIDTQSNMFDPALPAHAAESLLARLRNLVAQARAAQIPVVFVRNCGQVGDPDERGTPGWELHPALGVAPGDLVVDKSTGDSFASTPLDDELRARGVTRLVVAGLQSEFCVRDTVLGALARGYEVTLASDGHSTYDGASRSALEKSAALNAELADRVALVRVEELRLP
jgi:nicotinamidase-related amidase